MKVVAGRAAVEDVDEFVAALGDAGDRYDCAVQAVDADYVADRAHLASAVRHADRAFERGENVATERAVEILLYAAGRRQIRQALEMGVSEGEQTVAVVVAADHEGGDEDAAADAVAECLTDAGVDAGALADGEATGSGGVVGDAATLRGFFEVSDAELDAAAGDLPGVVRERVALLDVEK